MESGQTLTYIRPEGCRGIFVRRAYPSDLDAISSIESKAHLRPWSKSGIYSELSAGSSSLLWVACAGRAVSDIRGYICFRIIRPEVYILNLAVEEKFRRRGLGRWLLSLSMRLGVTRGASRVALDVHGENAGAIKFYRRFGFSFTDNSGKNKKIFSVMEMHLAESCLDFNIGSRRN